MNKKKYLVTPKDGDEYVAELTDQEVQSLRSQGAIIKNPATGQANVGMSEELAPSTELPDQSETEDSTVLNQSDILNAAKTLKDSVETALKQHKDSVAYLRTTWQKPATVNVYVHYEQDPDNPGAPVEDKFSFKLADGKVQLADIENPVDICSLEKQSGTINLNKDLIVTALTEFIDSHDILHEEDEDIKVISDKDSDKDLILGFEKAVEYYRKSPKKKEDIKNLIKASKVFEGADYKEKFKNAYSQLKKFKDKMYLTPDEYKNSDLPYRNSLDPSKLDKYRKKMGLEEVGDPKPIFDSEGFDVYKDFLTPVAACLEKFKNHVNRTQDTWVGSYYRAIFNAVEKFSDFVQTHDEAESLDEAVRDISEENILEAFKVFKKVEKEGYQDPWFRGHAPGKVDLTCIAQSEGYKFIWDVPAEMDEKENVVSTGKIYELDITFPNGKTINLNEASLEKRNFYEEESA